MRLVKLKYYGVRGSIASPGPSTVGYGGNTSCVYIEAGDRHIIMDAGTGLRQLGIDLLAKGFGQGQGEAFVFVTHLHWDHIQGIPFFPPVYIPGNKISFYCSKSFTPSLHSILKRQQAPPTFPTDADFRKLQSTIRFFRMEDGSVAHLDPVLVKNCPGNHPGGGYFYRVDCEGKSIVYATDYEHSAKSNKALVRFAKGADVLIYDAQYMPAEYEEKFKNWGHSTYVEGAKIAKEAGVGSLHLFHHDPNHDDKFLDELLPLAQKEIPNVVIAKEGMEVEL